MMTVSWGYERSWKVAWQSCVHDADFGAIWGEGVCVYDSHWTAGIVNATRCWNKVEPILKVEPVSRCAFVSLATNEGLIGGPRNSHYGDDYWNGVILFVTVPGLIPAFRKVLEQRPLELPQGSVSSHAQLNHPNELASCGASVYNCKVIYTYN
jgi:hypothetical protein